MIDGLVAVRVPSGEEEALRDLVRAREDVRGDLMRARHRLGKMLLRHDIRFDDTTSRWGQRHRAWLAKLDLAAPGAQATLSDYVGAIDTLVLRRETLEAAIAELVPDSPLAQTVARLRCLRGIDTLSAVGLAVEVGDFARFQRAGQPRRARDRHQDMLLQAAVAGPPSCWLKSATAASATPLRTRSPPMPG